MQKSPFFDDPNLRRLYYRATHRGMKEQDIIMGQYAAVRLSSMTAAELDIFEEILAVEDQTLLKWILGKIDVPAEHQSSIMDELKNFPIDEAVRAHIGS